jgi:hypothetical protein
MSEGAATRVMLDAAERAATAGDFASAYELLRGALRRQEESLGAAHPDLANTLNNLAVVAERTGREKEAEPLYRRAAAIAKAAFPPDHPMVVASRQNLEDFCRARGVSIEAPASEAAIAPPVDSGVAPGPDTALTPAPDTAVTAAPDNAVTPAPDTLVMRGPDTESDSPVPDHLSQAGTTATAARDVSPGDDTTTSPRAAPLAADRSTRPAPSSQPLRPPPGSTRTSRPLVWLAVAAGIIVVTVLLLLRPGSSRDASMSQPAAAAQPDASDHQPTSAPPRDTPAPSIKGRPITRGERNGSTGRPATASVVTIVAAEVCRTLSTSGRNWRCEPIGDSVAPGRVVFYTRLKSTRNAAVMHRWYRGGTLRRSVRLTTRANANEGYRTYSRQTVDKGEWRVELTSADGDVLHEKRFVVR